jgi:hypothetical protein
VLQLIKVMFKSCKPDVQYISDHLPLSLQPSMDDSEALDLLSRDLSSSTGPAAASVVVTTEQRQPRLEVLTYCTLTT